VAFGSAAFSGAALLAHAAGFMPMYFLVNLLGAPSIVILLAAGALAHRIHAHVFLNRLWVGLWGGLVSTLAYDGIRLLLRATDLIVFNPFLSHPAFGKMITGQPETTPLALAVGWAYHFWNGIGFGIMYTLVAGKAAWGYGLLWALILEVAWLTALPSAIGLKLNPQYVVVSLIGHGAYGVALGLLARRYILE
jgi:hypothetical protein